jgi:hypothetical protein
MCYILTVPTKEMSTTTHALTQPNMIMHCDTDKEHYTHKLGDVEANQKRKVSASRFKTGGAR